MNPSRNGAVRQTLLHLRYAGIVLLATLLVPENRSQGQTGQTPGPAATIERHAILYEAQGSYCAWPTVARAANNDILVFFTETEEHLGPDGAIRVVRSTDNGSTWQSRETHYDSPIDDRESGVTVLRDGTMMTHLWSTFHTRARYAALPALSYEKSVLGRWSNLVDASPYRKSAHAQGAWHVVSRDHGKTWTRPARGRDAVHGGIQLFDGTLLIASYREDQGTVGVYGATSPEGEYALLSSVRSPRPDSIRFGEPHILQLVSGRVIMMLRATAVPYDDTDDRCVLWETYSDDGGRSWATPFPTRLWGFPPHLLQLSDGRILCSYGYRRPPFGQRACTSADGITWNPEDEIVLRADAPNGDLGYPASVELGRGRILTVYYQPPVSPGTAQRMHPPDPHRRKPAILGTTWKISPFGTPDVPELGSWRELFVDSALIERLSGGSLRLHHPELLGVALKFDKPWEGPFSAYTTVIKDGPTYRMYYRGLRKSGRDEGEGPVTCYAESHDGISWTKPELDLYPLDGSRKTNIILAGQPQFSHNFSPYLDVRPGVPRAERYKAVAGNEETGLLGFVSADGIRWRRLRNEPLITDGQFDSQNVVFWWEPESTYVCLLRTWTGEGYTGFRTISRSTSRDFLNWTKPVPMTFGGTRPEHLYTNGTQPYYRSPHIAVALAKRFFPDRAGARPEVARTLIPDSGYGGSTSDAVFMTTRGGNRYDRTFMEAFLRPGATIQDWVSRDNTPALGVVPFNERELLLYRGSHYAQPSAHLSMYRLRVDGFASLHAPYTGCELVTKPLRFTGTRLEVNLSTSAAGGLRVEIQDPGGRPILGYVERNAVELRGDGTDLVVSWDAGTDLSRLEGKPVRLRFVLRDGDLYSYRFVAP